MAPNEIRQPDRDSRKITLPKGDLQVAGVVDANGDLTGERRVHVRHVGEVERKLEFVDDLV